MVDSLLTLQTLRNVNIARCIAEKPQGFNHPLKAWSVLEWGGAPVGEFGEACNIAKKMIRYRDNLAGNKEGEELDVLRFKLGCEIADGVHYATLWAASQDIDLDTMLRHVFNEKSKQIGSSFRL